MELAEAIEGVLAELRRENLSEATIRLYRHALGGFAKAMAAQGVHDVRDIGREHIEAHQAKLLTTNSARTTAQRIQALRRLFRHLGEQGQLLINPADEVVALKYARRIPRRLVTEEEMARLLAAPKASEPHGVRDRAMLEVLYGTGMRIGELIALEMGDVDRELGLARIREGKGGKDRTVPLGTAAKQWVKQYVERVRPWWMRGKEGELRLWVTKHGRPYMRNNIHHMLHVYSQEAGIKAIYPHAIRHATATHMLQRGADLRVIQKLLGHKSIRTTQRYTKVVPLDLKWTHARTHPLEATP